MTRVRIVNGQGVPVDVVREILALERAGTTLDAIGRRFHLSRAAVEKLVRRRASNASNRACTAHAMHTPRAQPRRARRAEPMPLTILVADDDPVYREIVRYLLAAAADTVTIVGEAADGDEALALVLRMQPGP